MEHNETINEIDLKKTFSIWWSMVWRSVLGGILVGAIFGFISGFIFGIIGRPELGGITSILLGYLVSIPVTIWALKSALSKKHQGYSVVLVKSS